MSDERERLRFDHYFYLFFKDFVPTRINLSKSSMNGKDLKLINRNSLQVGLRSDTKHLQSLESMKGCATVLRTISTVKESGLRIKTCPELFYRDRAVCSDLREHVVPIPDIIFRNKVHLARKYIHFPF
jgi:hypothetical protein